MKALQRLRVHYGRDPESELRLMQRRFRAVRQRHERASKLRRLYHRTSLPVMGAIAATTLYLGLTSTFPGLATTAREYLTYFPNCDAARRAGVAPLYRDEPGYRLPLDRDNDGIACEPWPRR